MTSAFDRMKASRDAALEALEQKLAQGDKAPQVEDTSYWKPTRDSAGNASAVIRFLGPSEGETVPYVQVWSHAFQGPTGQWYIERSLTTIGKQDAVSEHNKMLWATGIEANRKLASARKRKLQYISNIYVVKDPGNPENEGKVFKYKYGQKIFDMIKDAWKPEFEDQEPIRPFDMMEGANFRLRMKTVDRFPNYESSSWDKPGPLFTKKDGSPDEKQLGEVYENQYKLQEELDLSNFKPAEDLHARFFRVIGEGSEQQAADEAMFRTDAPTEAAPRAKASAAPKTAPKTAAAVVDDGTEEENWFKDLDLN